MFTGKHSVVSMRPFYSLSCRYYFNHMSSRNEWPDWAGVKHGDEIEFTFGLPLANPKDYEAKEVALATDVVTYWTNFVKTG